MSQPDSAIGGVYTLTPRPVCVYTRGPGSTLADKMAELTPMNDEFLFLGRLD